MFRHHIIPQRTCVEQRQNESTKKNYGQQVGRQSVQKENKDRK